MASISLLSVLTFLDALGGFGEDEQTGIVDTLWNQLTQPSLSEEDLAFLEKERNRIDLKYCGGPCRFMNLEMIVEQGIIHTCNCSINIVILNTI